MKNVRKDNSQERDAADISDAAFELLIKELVSYSEALKCFSDQVEQRRRFENS